MKTSTIPAVRVERELRAAIESHLEAHETLSQFVEGAVRDAVQRRQHESEFVARGMRSLERARATGAVVAAEQVVGALERRLAAARRQAATRRR